MKTQFIQTCWSVVRLLLSIALASTMAMSRLAVAADKPETPAAAAQFTSEDAARLQKELDRLRDENTQLRKENQQLRRMLAEVLEPKSLNNPISPTGQPIPVLAPTAKAVTPTVAPRVTPVAPSPAAVAPAAVPAKDGFTHWLSSSGKRHNSNCRYFKNTEGRAGRPDEGTPCKVCGG